MATDTTIEARLETIELEIEELKRKIGTRTIGPNWLDQVIGILEDEPGFKEVLRLGREYRLADRPAEGPEP